MPNIVYQLDFAFPAVTSKAWHIVLRKESGLNFPPPVGTEVWIDGDDEELSRLFLVTLHAHQEEKDGSWGDFVVRLDDTHPQPDEDLEKLLGGKDEETVKRVQNYIATLQKNGWREVDIETLNAY